VVFPLPPEKLVFLTTVKKVSPSSLVIKHRTTTTHREGHYVHCLHHHDAAVVQQVNIWHEGKEKAKGKSM